MYGIKNENDTDVPVNVKAVRRQIQQHHIVGSIQANKPDFEFANFSLDELVEIAARLDDKLGFDGSKVKQARWAGIARGRQFEDHYAKVSDRKGPLKGKDWGEALAEYALQNQRNTSMNTERPLLRQVLAALRGWDSNYDFQKKTYAFDAQTFEQKPR
jgi:hypothetical protein